MTAPDNQVPDSGYTVTTLGQLQALDEAKVKQQLLQPASTALEQIKSSIFTNLLGGIAKAIAGAFNPAVSVGSWFGEVKDALKPAYDGQVALNTQVELLSIFQDYCRTNAVLENNGHARFGAGLMPFKAQVGPSKNVTLLADGRMRLLDQGMWEINARVVPSWTGIGNVSDLTMEVRVFRPDGTLYSAAAATEKTNNVTTLNVNTTVTINQPGFVVGVYMAQCGSSRGVYGGPKYSEFNVQHLSRTLEHGTGSEQSSDTPDSNGPG